MLEKEKLRIDKYLWAIRLFKTRTQAAEAIAKGKVKWNGEDVKASKQVQIGDTYSIKTEARKWVIEVTNILHERLQFTQAIKYYVDKTPAELLVAKPGFFIEQSGNRQSKQGRPTKKNRRNLGDLLNQ